MADVLTELRAACAQIADRAEFVRIDPERASAYVGTLPVGAPSPGPDPDAHLTEGTREQLAAFWLTLDAINFGSGWFPTLRKRDGRSGYFTVATGVRDRFANDGPWSAGELAQVDAAGVARVLGQDPDHELMELFARSLGDLGPRVEEDHGGSFAALVDSAGGSAPGGSAAASPATADPATASSAAAGPATASPVTVSPARLTIDVTGRSVVVLRGVGAPAALAQPQAQPG